jgi:hypothetical protein
VSQEEHQDKVLVSSDVEALIVGLKATIDDK